MAKGKAKDSAGDAMDLLDAAEAAFQEEAARLTDPDLKRAAEKDAAAVRQLIEDINNGVTQE